MPRDSGANYSLPSGYLATTGQTIEATQHNAPLEDLATAMTGSLPRNGTGAMQADLPMAGFKITGMADGSASGDAVTKGQLDSIASVAATTNAAATKTTPNDDDRIPMTDSATSYTIKRFIWSDIRAALKTYFDALYSSIAHTHTVTEGGSWLIPAPEAGDYTLILKAPYAGTITETTSKSAAGTCTATFKINSTALGGAANAVSTTEQSVSRSTANAFVAGDDIVVTIASVSSCTKASLTITWTRTI